MTVAGHGLSLSKHGRSPRGGGFFFVGFVRCLLGQHTKQQHVTRPALDAETIRQIANAGGRIFALCHNNRDKSTILHMTRGRARGESS